MPDYANGKIYKIVCNITGDQYIGGTTQKLSQRLTQHVSSSKKTCRPCKSRDIILMGDYQIVLIENYSCNNKEELERKEREHIESNICVNKCIPTRTAKEYYDTNRESLLLVGKEWRDTHKEVITIKQKEYRDMHKEELSLKSKEYYCDHKDEIKSRANAYYDTNKEHFKQYYETNKEKILESRSKIDKCECGINYTFGHKSRHIKSIKHCQFIESQTINPEDGAE
jgi:hypothetical protein